MMPVLRVEERDGECWIKQEEVERGEEAEGEFGIGSGSGGGIRKGHKLHMARAKAIDFVTVSAREVVSSPVDGEDVRSGWEREEGIR